jgi:Domain of unknown function (DUF1902)
MEKTMKIVIRAFWDGEAQVWAAKADDNIGIFTESPTLEKLWQKLPELACDFLEVEKVDIELIVTDFHMVAAE